MIDIQCVIDDLERVRHNSPLVHNITNYVVMNSTANALLALGASPVMAHSTDEVTDMVALAGALVLNIGTLDASWVAAMELAAAAATKRSIPIILDPVGAGATPYRTRVCRSLIEQFIPAVIRGNASEIIALTDSGAKSKGVDSLYNSNRALESASILSQKYNTVVVISGQTDYIVSSDRISTVNNGSSMMTKVTGMGCTATAVTGAFAAINKDYFQASLSAMTVMGVVGEMAAGLSKGPGSLQVNFIDQLYLLDAETLKKNIKPDKLSAQ